MMNVLISGQSAKSRQDTSKMSFVPYGFLYEGKPVEGYLKKHKTHFTPTLPISQTQTELRVTKLKLRF